MDEWSVPNEGTKEFLEFAKEVQRAKEKYQQKLERALEGSSDTAMMRRSAPKGDIRREGFWGKPKKKDLDYQEIILDTQRDLEFLAYAEAMLAKFSRGSRKMITSLIREMEEDDDDQPEGSLSQIVGHALTFHTAKNLSKLHMDITNLFSQAALNRRFNGIA
jgi:mRNA-degrading endonuclease RelE of RelBE toxin-antitoxin system